MDNRPDDEDAPAQRAKSEAGPQPRAGTATAERFRALDAIAVRAQAVRDPAALLPAVGDALRALGFNCHIDEWDPVAGEVVIRYVSLPPALRRAVETVLNRSVDGLRLPVDRVPSLQGALTAGRTVYLETPEDEIAAAVPWLPRPAVRYVMQLVDIRRLIVAPLLANDTALGVLVVMGNDLAAEDVPFMASLATHVGEALAAARTLEAARRREAAALALGELSTCVASGATPEELPALAVRTLRRPLGAAATALWLLDGDRPCGPNHRGLMLRLVAQEGVPPHAVPSIAEIPLSADRLAARVARDGRTLALWGHEASTEPPDLRTVLAGMRSGLAITAPLRAGGRILGALALTFVDARPAAAEERAFVEAVATQIAAALENARLLAETRAQAVRASEGRQRLAATFASMVDAVYLYDAEGQVLDLNEAAARLLGLPSRAEALGAGTDELRFVELRHPDGRAISDADRPSRRAVRGEMVAGFDEIVYNRVTGEERHVIVNAAPIPDDEGGIAGAVLVAHDVTALRAAERVKDEFLLVASHELKTPLTPLKGLLQIMDTLVTRAEQGRPLDYARLRRYLRMMAGRVDRLVELVAAMLDLSRLQAGLFALDLAPVDLVPLTAEVLARFADRLEARQEGRHHLVLEAPAPVVASCDPNRVEQVLTNLVENALKYSPGGGQVLVRVTQEGNQAVLTVDDDGIGIPEGEVDSLFRPFARGSNAPALQYAGVGLGLYICREIVERHGGSIGAGPRDPAGARPGTSFRVTLPLAGPQPIGSRQ